MTTGEFWEFARLLDQTGVEMWIRHVYVNQQWNPPQDLMALGRISWIAEACQGGDVLPYHTMGEVKYQRLGLDYPLKGIAPASAQQAREARQTILQECGRREGKRLNRKFQEKTRGERSDDSSPFLSFPAQFSSSYHHKVIQ